MIETSRERDPTTGLILARQLDEELVNSTGLNTPKEAYEQVAVDEVLMRKRQQADAIYPLIQDLYDNEDVRFVVVAGRDVFTSTGDPWTFDNVRFAQTVPTKPLFMLRPVDRSQPPMFFEKLFPLP